MVIWSGDRGPDAIRAADVDPAGASIIDATERAVSLSIMAPHARGLASAMNATSLLNSIMRSVSCVGTMLTAVVLCGCATPALWKSTAAGHWVPRPPERVCIFTTGTTPSPDVAVFFTQTETSRSPVAQRPALWRVSESPTNLVAGAVAISTATNKWRGVRSIPLYKSANDVPAGQTTSPPGYAVLLPSRTAFTVHFDGFPAGPYELPTTDRETQIAARVVSMPLAVGVDAALIAAAFCGAAFLDYASTGPGCH